MSNDIIRYDLLVQEALRSVVKKVLVDAARDGLPGEHHFYVTFRTGARGVRLSTRMREKYPEEMTVILQHQFWDLVVTDQGFEVGLSFSNIPERLLVPFDSVVGFFDPSVQFGLKFEVQDISPEEGANDTAPTPETAAKIASRPGEKPTPRVVGAEPVETKPAVAAKTAQGGGKPRAEKASAKTEDKAALDKATADKDALDKAARSGETKVVSIDAFRKKP